jgi:addiction module HigA family antidote
MKNPPRPGRIVRQECIGPLGLTITAAANHLGVTRQALNNLVNGKNRRPLALRGFDARLYRSARRFMTTRISIQEAQTKLPELIHDLHEGAEVVITEHSQPVARLLPAASATQRKVRQPGTLRGTVLYMAPDFDAPLDDFKEYME